MPGGGKGSRETPGLQRVSTLPGNVKRSLDSTFHACGAKHAGRYLGAFACRSNRRCRLKDFLLRLTPLAVRPAPLPAA